MTSIRKNAGEIIMGYIRKNGITKISFARMIGPRGVSPAMVSYWLRTGRVSPRCAVEIEKATSGEIKAADLLFDT